ncbi:MAG: hypothetical protein K2N84_04800, partial [Clostridia bacterium]|nr:hypothetical protein [Clostridia bacterium]
CFELERDLRVETIAGVIGLRANCWLTTKFAANCISPVGCVSGRAVKGANPFFVLLQNNQFPFYVLRVRVVEFGMFEFAIQV